MERQRRVLMRDDPPRAWFVVDQLSLYRQVGSPDVMEGQMRRLAEVAAMPNVTVQVLPAVAHPANASELIVTESAAYAESLNGGYVFTEEETVSRLLQLFHSIHCESYRASESLRMIERLGEAWATGGNPLTRTPTRLLRSDGQQRRRDRGAGHHRPGRRDAGVPRPGLGAVASVAEVVGH